jgi:hypothetical protein
VDAELALGACKAAAARCDWIIVARSGDPPSRATPLPRNVIRKPFRINGNPFLNPGAQAPHDALANRPIGSRGSLDLLLSKN